MHSQRIKRRRGETSFLYLKLSPIPSLHPVSRAPFGSFGPLFSRYKAGYCRYTWYEYVYKRAWDMTWTLCRGTSLFPCLFCCSLYLHYHCDIVSRRGRRTRGGFKRLQAELLFLFGTLLCTIHFVYNLNLCLEHRGVYWVVGAHIVEAFFEHNLFTTNVSCQAC